MGKLFWYLNRLQARDLREVCWRVQQRLLAKAEKKRFGKQRVRVDGEVWNEALREDVYKRQGYRCFIGHDELS